MIGITAFGSHVPYYRLRRSAIQGEAGPASAAAERAVAGFDEDSSTMAVAAALNATHHRYGLELAAVSFATTTPPYAEKSSDVLVAAALDLPAGIRTAQFTGNLRVATAATISALDAVASGTTPVLVAAADMRPGAAGGSLEANGGDAAAAVVIGRDQPLAAVLATCSVATEIVDVWRDNGDRGVRTWDERFHAEAVGKTIPDVVHLVLQRAGLGLPDITHVILSSPSRGRAVLKQLGVAVDRMADDLSSSVGFSGAAHPLLMLANTLEHSKPGDTILLVAYGGGADALVFQVQPEIQHFAPRRTVRQLLAAKDNRLAYPTYLKWRERLACEPPRRPAPPRPSAPMMFRNARRNLALYGSRCRACGAVQFPYQRVCFKCRARDQMDLHGFRDQCGRLSTFSADYLSYSLAPPELVAVVDFPNGGRMLCNMTDVDPMRLMIGQPVEMTFRRMLDAGGIHSYFWKAQSGRSPKAAEQGA